MDRNALMHIMPAAGGRCALMLPHLVAAMAEFNIDNPLRQAAFLAQIAHESGRLKWMHELWGPTPAQQRYERDFAAAWPPTTSDMRNRKAWDLGNSEAGDGVRFKGRGLIQTTGRENYRATSSGLFGDERLLRDPTILEEPETAARSAAWFWNIHGLSPLADEERFEAITRIINGGLNGQQDRLTYYKRARDALGVGMPA